MNVPLGDPLVRHTADPFVPPGTIYRVKTLAHDPDWLDRTVTIYADGGCINKNPSPFGGTWAWLAADEDDDALHAEHGWFTPPAYNDGGRELVDGIQTAGNNQAEFLALALAMQAIKGPRPGWSGLILTDSQLTINRWSKAAGLRGIPFIWRRFMGTILRMPGRLSFQLLDGHPTMAQLASGVGKRGNPVSVHNKECDSLCRISGEAAQRTGRGTWTRMSLDSVVPVL